MAVGAKRMGIDEYAETGRRPPRVKRSASLTILTISKEDKPKNEAKKWRSGSNSDKKPLRMGSIEK